MCLGEGGGGGGGGIYLNTLPNRNYDQPLNFGLTYLLLFFLKIFLKIDNLHFMRYLPLPGLYPQEMVVTLFSKQINSIT